MHHIYDPKANILSALDSIPVADLTRQEWIEVGMALKSEGFDCGIWDDWSRNDSRYKPGECPKKWAGFNGSGVTGGTIIHMAQERGWTAQKWTGGGAIPWKSENGYNGPGKNSTERAAEPPQADDLAGLSLDIFDDVNDSDCRFAEVIEDTQIHFYIDDLIQIIAKLFYEDEQLNYVTYSQYNSVRGKWLPGDIGTTRRAGDLLKDLRSHRNDPIRVLGTVNPAAGVWMRINPVDGQGVKNKNVTAFRHALVECDNPEMPPREQEKIYRRLRLPVACMIYSGAKSLHAWVKIDAPDSDTYSQRVRFLYAVLKRCGLPVDEQNKNPARLSRMPGAVRGDQVQRLIDASAGFDSWDAWHSWITEKIETAKTAHEVQDVHEVPEDSGAIAFDDFIGDPDDAMPAEMPAEEPKPEPEEENKPLLKNEPEKFSDRIVKLNADFFKNQMQPRNPELIAGVLRQGHKMLITGASKTGKSFLAIQLAAAVAEGGSWLGFKCERGKVLYLNCEVHEPSFEHRVLRVYEALGFEPSGNFDAVNLRGRTKPLEDLTNDMLADADALKDYKLIVIDPIYKVLSGDENSASDMGKFVRSFDRICEATGAACAYVHHHAKGYAGNKRTADRMSGSGVFARDPDAILDVSELELTDGMKAASDDDGMPLRVEFILREFRSPKPVDMWFRYPVHVLDTEGALTDLGIQGSPVGNLAKTGKMSTDYEQLEQIRMCFEELSAFEDATKEGIRLDTIANMICPERPGQSSDRRIENGKRKIQIWFKHNELLQAEYQLHRGTVYPVSTDEK